MAHLWRVSEVNRAGDSRLPLIMKVPRIKGGEDPATIVGFEVEQMIMPALRARMCRSSSPRATSRASPTS
jgi:hypothetical protein